jgi:adenylosuccinate lyase
LLTVLRQLEVFPAAIAAENARQLPFLSTTTILMEAVKAGSGRETAHQAIKEHALATARDLRDGGRGAGLLERLAGDVRVGLDLTRLERLLAQSERFVGAAPQQVDAFVRRVQPLSRRFPEAVSYRPAPLL